MEKKVTPYRGKAAILVTNDLVSESTDGGRWWDRTLRDLKVLVCFLCV